MIFNALLDLRKNKESLKPFLEDEKEFRSINKFDTQNKLRVLFGYDKLERPKKKVKPVNTLDKYFK